MAEMSLRESFTDVGHSSEKRSSLPDEGSAPTPKRHPVVASGQATTIAMFENAKNIIINGGQFNQTISMPTPRSSPSGIIPRKQVSTILSDNFSGIYQQHMASVRAGTALWIPEGHSNLLDPYQGVSIGDVGTVTRSGSFSFLFNICLPADHPVNRNLVPEGFKPICPPVDPCDIREIHEFMPMDYLSTDCIRKLANDSDDSTSNAPLISFQVQEGEGSVVVMPEGAISQDLENVSKFRSYAASNLENWYRYVNVTRGREIKNGELRLVIGCDKTTSWAIAAVPRQNKVTTLHLRTARDNQRYSFRPYSWDSSGFGQARAGPTKYRNPKDADNTPPKLDQCLFVRTMNLKLGINEWCALAEQVGEARHHDCMLSPSSSSSSQPASSPGLELANSSSRPRIIELPAWLMTETSILNPHLQQGGRVTVEPPGGPPTPFKHASDLLHNIMLSLYPKAKMAITEDDEFLHYFKLLNPNDPTSTLSHDQLVDRLKELYEIKYDGVIVYLEKKNLTPPGEDAAKHDDSDNPTYISNGCSTGTSKRC
ncbi:hypothetical protein CPC08DRAFT_713621 [Agrocybe pediades]|nr:hypothetical protein CPC08DRAFT_713621 [Agrocybe pediades]